MADNFLARLNAAPTAGASYADRAPGYVGAYRGWCVRSHHAILYTALDDGSFELRAADLLNPLVGCETGPLTEALFGIGAAGVRAVVEGDSDLSLKIRRVDDQDWLVVGLYDSGAKQFVSVSAQCPLAPSTQLRAMDVTLSVGVMRREDALDGLLIRAGDRRRSRFARIRSWFKRR